MIPYPLASWGSPGQQQWYLIDGKPRRLVRGRWLTGRPTSRLISRAFFRRVKRRDRRHVSPSRSRFLRRHP